MNPTSLPFSILYVLLGIYVGSSAVMFALGHSKKVIPFVGFRVGYVYVSQRLWRKYSYTLGGVFLGLGGLTYLVGILIGPLEAIVISTIVMIFLTVLFTFLSERDAEKEAIRIGEGVTKVKFSPIPLGIPTIIVGVLSFFLCLSYIVYVYPSLPPIIPTHFTYNGTPNAYSSKESGVLGLLFGIGIISSITIFLGVLGVKKPEAYYRPYMKWEKMKKLIEYLLIIMMIINVVIAGMILDILYYIQHGHFAIPPPTLGMIMILGAVSTLGVAIYYTLKGYVKPKLPQVRGILTFVKAVKRFKRH